MNVERRIEDSFARGQANAHLMQLAHHHCQDMEFVPLFGQSIAENLSGLPMTMRTVRCPQAHGRSASHDLRQTLTDFYAQNCKGCPVRRPTGIVPSLSTLLKADAAAALKAQEAADAELAEAREQWGLRSARRQAIAATSDLAGEQLIRDLQLLDADPAASTDETDRKDALRRLTRVAERAPQLFTEDVAAVIRAMIVDQQITELLGPLRVAARSRPSLADEIVDLSIGQLELAPARDAAFVLVELRALVDAGRLTANVIRSLVRVSYAPATDIVGHFEQSESTSPAVLDLAADLAPDTLCDLLTEMLPGPRSAPTLLLLSSQEADDSTLHDERDRITAATAIAHLLRSHPSLADRFPAALIRNVVIEVDDYDRYASSRVARTIAIYLAARFPGVEEALDAAGENASDEDRERLFSPWYQLSQMLDSDRRRIELNDPKLSDADIEQLVRRVVARCLAVTSGQWGLHVATDACELITHLTRDHPATLVGSCDALLGGAIDSLSAMNVKKSTSLITPDDEPELIAGANDYLRKSTLGGSAYRLLEAVASLAAADAVAVTRTVLKVIEHHRDSETGDEFTWRAMKILGTVGSTYGAHGQVLPLIAPTLATYMLDEPWTASHAMNAWATIAHRHPMPSTFEDLLPALLENRNWAVGVALLDATPAIPWTTEAQLKLLRHALLLFDQATRDTPHDAFETAFRALFNLGRHLDDLRPHIELHVSKRLRDLDPFTRDRMLDADWLPATKQSKDWVVAALLQVLDPNINRKITRHDDDVIVRLLDAVRGLHHLEQSTLIDAAVAFGPDQVFSALELVEVAWRANRTDDVRAMLDSVLQIIPQQPAYDFQRHAVSTVLAAAAHQPPPPVLDDDDDPDLSGSLHNLARLYHRTRTLLNREDTSTHARAASKLKVVARKLKKGAKRRTSTAAYVRGFAELCVAAAHLLSADEAELSADASAFEAHLRAARRVGAATADKLTNEFGGDDPLVAPLIVELRSVAELGTGTELTNALRRWSGLELPLLMIEGPKRRRWSNDVEEPTPATPTAVALVSIDDRLLTGPAILNPGQVYTLSVEVQPDSWPDWATQMDLEFIGSLGEPEVQLPTLSWSRPADPDTQTFTGDGMLVLRFGLAAQTVAVPFALSIRWRGFDPALKTERFESLDVAGHAQIRMRPLDATRDNLTDNPALDEHLLAIYSKLAAGEFPEPELQAFCRLFTAICRVGFRFSYDKRYRIGTRVTERKFHDDLFEALLAEPELEGRLERGSPLALGFLDIRHDRVTAELKVERRTPVSKDSATKYIGQPTQYAAADGSRLSILSILDMSPKQLPIGVPQNYIHLLGPQQHGMTEPTAPSVVALMVVNGNLPVPSTWPRRGRLPVVDEPTD